MAALFTSCKTIKIHEETISNEIKSEKLALNTYFDKDEYTIIGTVSGESDFVWYNALTNTYHGDSGKYGYIYEPTEVNIGEKIFVGTGKKLKASEADPALQRAKLNANYQLIENAYTLGGDSIFDPIYTVESIVDITDTHNIRKYKVTVRAMVIKLKTE
jgi:hypothetical protein